jgi:hypothetical protein
LANRSARATITKNKVDIYSMKPKDVAKGAFLLKMGFPKLQASVLFEREQVE